MKKLFTTLTFLLIAGVFPLFLTNCGENQESNSRLVGTWNVTSVDYDAYVGSMTLEEYYLNELGYTQAEADLAVAGFYSIVGASLESGLIEFEATYEYWTNIGDPAGNEGSWSINDGETVITLDEGTIWETPITILSFTSTNISISFKMEIEMDLDNNPNTDDETVTLDISMMELSKQNR